MDFFGTARESLTLEGVRAFLADAGDEGLTWEAKGTERPNPGSVRKHVCAFANAIGGFYIVGATREGRAGPWHVDPVEFIGDEPGPWLSKVIRNGLRPVPSFDVRSFTEDEKYVAVVRVDPVAEPPCMTTTGEVFARVSGESPPVEDPATLRRLYERGEARAAGASAEALRATSLREGEAEPEPPYLWLRVAHAPTGRIEDISGRLFSPSFAKNLQTTAAERLPSRPLFPYEFPKPARVGFDISPTQGALVAREYHAGESRERWTVRAAWDGSVALFLAVDVPRDDLEVVHLEASVLFDRAVRPAFEVGETLVAALGGYGRAHVVMRAFARRFQIQGNPQGPYGPIPGPNTLLPIQTWTDSDGRLSDDQHDRMRRELVRACGVMVYEPEEAADEA